MVTTLMDEHSLDRSAPRAQRTYVIAAQELLLLLSALVLSTQYSVLSTQAHRSKTERPSLATVSGHLRKGMVIVDTELELCG